MRPFAPKIWVSTIASMAQSHRTALLRSGVLSGTAEDSDERVLVDAAMAGAGVLLGCRSLLREPVRDGRHVRLLPDFEIEALPINLLYPAHPVMPKKGRRFIDWMVIESEERSRRNRLADTT